MILIIGAGVAGLAAARAARAAGAEVTLVTAGTLALGDACSTAMAQGGISAAIAPGDTAAAHARDTEAAGLGLVDADAARVLTAQGADEVRRIIAAGFAADRDQAGELSFGLEGAHGASRIVHAGGDRTGAVLQDHLVAGLDPAVRVFERTVLGHLHTEAGTVVGATLVTSSVGRAAARTEFVRASAVVLATGGYSALYPRTSNHAGATGDGIMAAAEAGAMLADLEFVQFHPTVLAGTGQLISEAVRGAGAALLDDAGTRFLIDRHPAAELAPRDVVSREIHRALRGPGATVWLDAGRIETRHGAGALARMFPAIDAAMRANGYEWAKEPVPVAPAAHYTMGGVATDLDGRTSVPGLFAAGEAASTGVHGANRLASNSLLEGLVFGQRAGAAATAYGRKAQWTFAGDSMQRLAVEAERVQLGAGTPGPGAATEPQGTAGDGRAPASHGDPVGEQLAAGLGIERDARGIESAKAALAAVSGRRAGLAKLIAVAALARTESRGAHQRSDYARTDPAQAARRAVTVAPLALASPSSSLDISLTAARSFAPC